MPTYEYKCSACGNHFEKFQSITAAPITRCPKCGKKKVRRLIGTGAALIFKGSGFYTTDYRDSSYKDKAKAESGASGGGDSTKSETKAEPKTETKAKADDAPAATTPAPKSEKKSDSKPEQK